MELDEKKSERGFKVNKRGCVFWFYARIEQIGRSKLRLNCILFKTDKVQILPT
ncbi:hypothetical protein KSS87_016762 [Heliosperma pusillum]|nr:hypothetical protein KSS87_016762 [Heliosperma pusillum]